MQQTGNPLDVAIDGNAFLVVQTPRGERYTRNGALQINAAGELVTSDGDRVLGDDGPIVFQPDRPRHHHHRDGTIRCARAPAQLDSRAASCASSPSPTAAAAEGRLQHLRGAGRRARRSRPSDAARHAGRDREIERALGGRDDAHDRGHARLHRGRQHPAAAGDMRRTSIERLAEVPA